MSEDLLVVAAVYSGFCFLDVVQHVSMSYFAFDAFIVTVLLLLARDAGEWIL